MKPIAVFYHGLFFLGDPPALLPSACPIIEGQMRALHQTGLLDQASHFVVGINGGEESLPYADLFIPSKAVRVMHGLDSRSENMTLVELEHWLPSHPGWNVLYFHSKGATHAPGSDYGEKVCLPWRQGMMQDLVQNWRGCVSDLEAHEVACSHFMRHMCDGTQNIAAGNFWWATSDFLATLPSIFLRWRITHSGIKSPESRYEAEVWIGNGRMPVVKEYRPLGGGGVP